KRSSMSLGIISDSACLPVLISVYRNIHATGTVCITIPMYIIERSVSVSQESVSSDNIRESMMIKIGPTREPIRVHVLCKRYILERSPSLTESAIKAPEAPEESPHDNPQKHCTIN